MSDCTAIDSLVTPYIDGELAAGERQLVDEHLRVCRSCHARVAAERTVHDLIRTRKPALDAERASPALRARCAHQAVTYLQPSRAQKMEAPSLTRRLAPLALAATLVVIVGGAFLYQATDRSARLMAAELTADHVKCFAMNALLRTHQDREGVERSMLSGFGWRMRVPAQLDRAGFELVGSRLCLYGEGKVAHLMYRHKEGPVSIFMLPKSARAEQIVEVWGHQAAIWSLEGRTFVLVAREPRADVERIVSLVQGALR